jgi:hypothetical protein
MGERWSSAKSNRVVFERGYGAQMMAIDGTWRRPCIIEDISDTGAKLGVDSSIDGLALKEFFLVLSLTGLAFMVVGVDTDDKCHVEQHANCAIVGDKATDWSSRSSLLS